VAGWTGRLDKGEKGIPVTIDFHFHNVHLVAARLAFFPETIAGTAEKRQFPRPLSFFQGFPVRPCDHQYFAGFGILCYDRNQAA
jgi:hypothetical protein